MEKFKVTPTVEERKALEHLVSVGKAAARKLAHARILLLADEGPGGPRRSDGDMIEALQVSPSTIARVRKRFVTEGFGAALEHRPQPPRPEKVKLTDSIEKQLIQLACSDPPQGRCCWTLELLADGLVALGCVQAVSREAVRRAPKKTIRRHRAKKPPESVGWGNETLSQHERLEPRRDPILGMGVTPERSRREFQVGPSEASLQFQDHVGPVKE